MVMGYTQGMHSHELLGIVFSISPVSETRAFGRQIIAFGGQMETAHFRPGRKVTETMAGKGTPPIVEV